MQWQGTDIVVLQIHSFLPVRQQQREHVQPPVVAIHVGHVTRWVVDACAVIRAAVARLAVNPAHALCDGASLELARVLAAQVAPRVEVTGHGPVGGQQLVHAGDDGRLLVQTAVAHQRVAL